MAKVLDFETGTEKKKAKKPREGEIARAWYESHGYMYDAFTENLIDGDGKPETLDHAAAALCRDLPDVSLARAKEQGEIWIRQNDGRKIDSLKRRVEELAAAYSDADHGAIYRFAERVGFADDAYEYRRLQLWLYEVCARALIPGEKTDGMLVLAGRAEGTEKTKFFNAVCRCLVGTDAPPYAFGAGKDGETLLAESPVVLVDEIDRLFGRVDVAELKTKITQTGAKIRAPYDKSATWRPFRAVFGATTNEEAPIPASEGEARRYWVLQPKKCVAFGNSAEVESVMRNAAHDVLEALREHASEYDPLTTVGKIWVQTPQEEQETAKRNRGLKVEDAATIAISVAVQAIRRQAPGLWNRVFPLKILAAAIETGDGRKLDADGVQWTPAKVQAASVRRLIAGRGLYRVQAEDGKRVKGVRVSALAAEFSPETEPPEQSTFFE